MLAIEEISVGEPTSRLPISTQFSQLGLSSQQARVYSRLYGFGDVPVAGVGEELPMLEATVDALLTRAGVEPARVGVIVHAHTGPYLGPLGQSLPRRLQDRFGDHVLTFGMQLHKCVSSLSALSVVDRLLSRRPEGTLAVLLVGECADSPDLRVLEMAVAGDVGCAVLLSRGGARDRVLAQTTSVHGQYAGGIYAQQKDASRRDYEDHFQDHLHQVLSDTLDRGGVRVDELRYVLPHNVNVNIWKKAAGRLGLPEDRLFLQNVARYAHCFGADVFLNLSAVRPTLQPGDHCLLASAGVGGSFGAVLIQH